MLIMIIIYLVVVVAELYTSIEEKKQNLSNVSKLIQKDF